MSIDLEHRYRVAVKGARSPRIRRQNFVTCRPLSSNKRVALTTIN